MAARRVTKSSVDWAKFATLVPENYTHEFRHLKVANDKFVGRVNALPAALKPIDFEKYKKSGVPATVVDQFANQYKALEIEYPKDLSNTKDYISKKEKATLETSKVFMGLLDEHIKVMEEYVEAVERVPHLGEMTREMYLDYFPEQRVDGEKNYLDALGFEKTHEAQNITIRDPMQEEIAGYPRRFKDYLQWQFCYGKYADRFKMANSDLYPDEPELEERRIEAKREEDIGDEIRKRKIEAVYPWWYTEETLDEAGLSKEKFHAAERVNAQGHRERMLELEAKADKETK